MRLTAPPDAPAEAPFAARERARRGHLIGLLLLALLLIEVGAFYQYLVVDDDHPLMVRVLVGVFALTVLAAALNRRGSVALAGLLLTLVADLPLAGVLATADGGRLDVLHIGALYLLVGSELIAASVLAPASVFAVAGVNSVLLLATVRLMPHTAALTQLLSSNDAQQALLGPVLMQVVVAFVAYLWARSVLTALRRADRAELIAELQRRDAERTHELEEGVRQLLAVHVQLANGNFQARVPLIRNQLLWQIGGSLNNLIGRLSRMAQADFLLHRTQEEARRLADAIRASRSDRPVLLPSITGTPLDGVIAALAEKTPGMRSDGSHEVSPAPGSPVVSALPPDQTTWAWRSAAAEGRLEDPIRAQRDAAVWLQQIWDSGPRDPRSGRGEY